MPQSGTQVPVEVSALAAAGLAVGAAVAVPLGPWVEFRRKQPVMVSMDLARWRPLARFGGPRVLLTGGVLRAGWVAWLGFMRPGVAGLVLVIVAEFGLHRPPRRDYGGRPAAPGHPAAATPAPDAGRPGRSSDPRACSASYRGKKHGRPPQRRAAVSRRGYVNSAGSLVRRVRELERR